MQRYAFSESLRAKIRQELRIEPETILLGSVGRLSVEKNQCFIVEMFKAFHERNQNSKLILVGDGALRSRIELKIAELGLNDAVIMTGKRTDIRAILSGLDIFIMPSFSKERQFLQ